ncbi:hypothetical protein KFU94_66955 [Chloroflexi bacterium TSY]|uniref:Calcium-binding protein n=1 Tax=Entotheonella factor TaxID=1429438 RepID=W4LFC7_ENTF1|nr:MAG: hypothetical protein ETSY1_25500 [Candidatus Entotheonella factor]MBV7331262.1 hypothetical protein [Chloroflexi bacterium TSY]MBV7336628.1 hypothetical protein [Chloroflexi bacterium TSY]MBV7339478.1 hypothetical protein [Chloroflexi bacterium TSY]
MKNANATPCAQVQPSGPAAWKTHRLAGGPGRFFFLVLSAFLLLALFPPGGASAKGDGFITTCGNYEIFQREGKGEYYAKPAFAGTLIVGTSGNDYLYGTADNDLIVGLGGKDNLWGEAGADTICGGPGHDYINGGPDHDTIDGGPGHDQIWGGEGHDTINGGPDHDHLWGEAGNDSLKGGRGDDSLWGFEGDDFLDGGPDDDYLDGMEGYDVCQDDEYWRKPVNCEEPAASANSNSPA